MLKKYIVRSPKLIMVLVNTVAVLRQGKIKYPFVHTVFAIIKCPSSTMFYPNTTEHFLCDVIEELVKSFL